MTAIPYTTKSGLTQFKPQLTEEMYRILADDMTGFCLACGTEAEGVEPDARKYTCESCSAPKVFGLEELLLMGLVRLVGEDDAE